MDAAQPNPPNKFSLAPGLKPEKFRADELGVHRITLARARNAGALAFVRIGDRIFYSERHVSEWLERNERPARETV